LSQHAAQQAGAALEGGGAEPDGWIGDLQAQPAGQVSPGILAVQGDGERVSGADRPGQVCRLAPYIVFEEP
jgi:hypothetical protein